MSYDEVEREEQETPRLHIEQRTKRADTPRDESRKKIRTAPGKSRCQAEQNSHKCLRGFTFHGQAELGHNFLQILPNFALRRRIAQEIGRVIRDH